MFKFLIGGSHFCYAPDDNAGGGNPAPAPAPAATDPAPAPATDPAAPAPAPAATDPAPAPATDPATPPPEQNWREKYARNVDGQIDKTRLAILNRYADEKSAMDALYNFRQRISSGELKGSLPKDATPEQIKEWREDNGIPNDPAEYLKALPDGTVFGEADKAALDPFLKEMHDLNTPPQVVAQALSAYKRSIELQNQRIADQDVDYQIETEDTLRKEWGEADYRKNLSAVDSFLTANFPKEAKAALLNARDENNRPLMSNPAVLRGLAMAGKALNPTGTTYGSGPDSIDSIETKIADYKKKMGTQEWFKREDWQADYRNLITARERINGRKTA